MQLLNLKSTGGSNAVRGLTSQRPRVTYNTRVNALFGFGKKNKEEEDERKAFRDEQFKLQQDILKRRKSGNWQAEVKERRGKVSRYLNDPEYKKIIDEENRAKFKAKRDAEEPVPKFGIIIPILPVGIPEYDGGERFDLRLPYVDNGWVDDDADFGKQVARFFGFGKKKDEGKGAEQSKKNIKGKKK